MNHGIYHEPIRPALAVPTCDLPNTFSDYREFVDESRIRDAVRGDVHWVRLGPWYGEGSRLFGRVKEEYAAWLRYARQSKAHVHIECQRNVVRIQALNRPYRKVAHWRDIEPDQTMQLRLTAEADDLEAAIIRAKYLRAKDGLGFEPFMAGEGLYLTRLPAIAKRPPNIADWSRPL